jgi:dUTP pyrophosphatase
MPSEYFTKSSQIKTHIKIKKLNDKAKIPTRSHMTDAGMDLCSVEKLIILPQTRSIISTAISVEIPEGYYGRVAPRSGLAAKHGIDVFAGVVDSSYRGEVKVILYNSDKQNPFLVNEGDRIAQLIIEKHYNFPVEEVSDLSDTSRGSGGFGSTGVS